MNQLTTVLDELDGRQSEGGDPNLPPADVQKLITALQSEGGDMARIASLIEILAREHGTVVPLPPFVRPNGDVRMPGNRRDVRTQTAGNGVMTGTGT